MIFVRPIDRDQRGPGAAAAVVVGDDIGGEHLLELVEPSLAGRPQQALQELRVPALVGLAAPPSVAQVGLGPVQELPGIALGHVQDLGDLGVGDVEGLAQDEHGALGRRELLHQPQRRQREGVALDQAVQGIERVVGDDRLGQPRAGVGLAGDARGAQLVQGQPAHHRGEEGGRLPDLAAVGAQPADHGVGDDVLRVPHAAQQPVGDAEQTGAQRQERRAPVVWRGWRVSSVSSVTPTPMFASRRPSSASHASRTRG